MASRVRLAAFGLGALLSTAVVWTGCNETRRVVEEDTGPLRDLRTTVALEIRSVELPETGPARITFRVTDQDGSPIDSYIDETWEGARTLAQGEQRATPFLAAPRFVIAMLQPDGDYLDYFVRAANGTPFIAVQGEDETPPAIASTFQANSDAPPTTDEAAFRARFEAQGDGVFVYTTGALDPEIVAQMDRTRTHTAAMWTTRNTADQVRQTTLASPANATLNFVPAGGQAERDEVVIDQACNACHGVMSAHDNRTGVQLCITCHSPEAPDPAGGARAANVDPETGNTVDFKQMIHKIHAGSVLPSVQDGTPYRIVGRATANPAPPNSVHDFSEVLLPRPVQNCTACHQGEDAAAYNTRPAVDSCRSCHDNVVFDPAAVGGLASCTAAETTAPCAHVGLPGLDLTNCAACHSPEDIDSHHVVPGFAERGQYRYEFVNIDVPEDRRPVITFRVVNPANGTPYDLRTHPTWTQAATGASRLFIAVGFPSNEYSNDVEGGPPYGQPISIPIITGNPINGVNPALEDAGNGTYRIVSPVALPPGVQSATAMLEGHPAVTPGGPTAGTRIPVTTAVEYFGVDGTPLPRREVTSVEQCNACHGVISFHGNNRNDSVQACAVCHNANATDKTRVPPGVAGETSIDLKWMIHGIHAGAVRQEPFTIFGFGGAGHEFPRPVPFDVANCNVCHTNGSFRLPLQDGVLGSTRNTGPDEGLAEDNVRDAPTMSACLGCHEGRTNDRLGMTAREHALIYVAANGSEACNTCHGTGGIVDVTQVHRLLPRPGDGSGTGQ